MLLMMHNSAAAIVSPIHRKAYSAASEVAMPHIKVEPDDDFKCKQHKQELRNTVYVNSDLVQNNIYNNFSKNNNNNSLSKCKRRINFTYSNLPGQQPTSVARRNARERNRVKQVNNGFATLRSHIPLSVAAAMTSPEAAAAEAASRTANKKLSKVETLRMAVEYIRSLQDMLEDPGSGPARQYDGYYPGVKHEDDSMSDTSTSPPPSSYASECSYVTPPSHHQNNNNNNNNNNNTKYLDKEDAMSPEDEELLDVISWWQQSQ